jgi:predicted component of type VI protein secretion system
MMSPKKSLGVMLPLGGGDPIPLKKDELIIGRRPTCDIRLDYDNISGRHCLLKFVRGTWHIRDLNSTNGTFVDGLRISSEHGLLPDNQLGIAGHLFRLEYDAAAPTSLEDANMLLKEEMGDELGEAPRQRSLMELAGLENLDSPNRRGSAPAPAARPAARPTPTPSPASKAERDREDAVDEPETSATDDDFFALIKEDVGVDERPKRRG